MVTTTSTAGMRRLGMVLAAALVLAACGGDPAAEETTDEPTTEAPATETEATEPEMTETETEMATEDGAGPTVEVASSDLGDILVDEAGMTLYVFDNDDVDTSACTGDCLGNWPPLLAEDVTAGEGVTAELGTFTRDDGDVQVTANGLPLYYFAADGAAGDTNGQAVGDVWWVVDPAGEKVTETANGAAATNDGYGEPNY